MPAVDVLNSQMFYVATSDAGVPFVFLHGNPTSSYLWRHVLPLLADQLAGGQARCLAPDLIGMGQSGKPLLEYSFADHASYLDSWFDAVGLEDVVLVGHDWGGALAFDWARRHPGRTLGVAFLETIIKPMSWEEFPQGARDAFAAFRTPGVGEALILDQNILIEQALGATTMSVLTDEDLSIYRAPYPTRQSRLPLLQWPRSLPLEGEPADVVAIVAAYGEWLADSRDVPKLLLAFEPGPGTMIGQELESWCQENISGLDITHCGRAGHHAPEDQPAAIAEAILAWALKHRLTASARPAGS